jgi:hypothetical protein
MNASAARSSESLRIEARARITWGESSPAVHAWLIERGLPHVIADEFVEDILRERGRSMRRRGLFDFVLGTVVVAISAAVIWGINLGVDRLHQRGVQVPLSVAGTFGGLAASVGVYGIYRLLRGSERLTLGAWSEGPDSDVGGLLG